MGFGNIKIDVRFGEAQAAYLEPNIHPNKMGPHPIFTTWIEALG
jgi:hypothetical protein